MLCDESFFALVDCVHWWPKSRGVVVVLVDPAALPKQTLPVFALLNRAMSLRAYPCQWILVSSSLRCHHRLSHPIFCFFHGLLCLYWLLSIRTNECTKPVKRPCFPSHCLCPRSPP
ncbi:hypothetical protein GQ607_000510 [Colletotrichum asianum]|uniref:Uncharacterized protein n=1 Tax=Colletotrichum asianum TaxID=702518 RepID=A0A8H3WSS6_9PEZI|nr:hypothetical protein GQ607_000510 [Colletotrichum asianum]